MIRNLTPSSAAFDRQVNALKGIFSGGASSAGQSLGGGTHLGGIQTAQAFLYNQLHRQAAMLSYLDILGFLGIFCICMIPLILMIGKIKPPADGPAAH